MNITEQANMNGSRLPITEGIIEQINRSNPTVSYSLEDKKNLFIAEGVLIDDRPTLNGNIYAPSFQRSLDWTGTPLVFSNHAPEPESHIGWVFNSEVRANGANTETVAYFVVPKIDETKPILDRLSNGLNKSISISVEVRKAECAECSKPIDLAVGRCAEHPAGHRRMLEGSRAIHVALVGDAASPAARITRTSEGVLRIDERSEPKPERVLSERETMLLTEAEKIRAPMIAEAVKYSKLLNGKVDGEALAQRLEKWSIDEIATFKEAHKTIYERANPNANKQLSRAIPTGEPSGAARTTEQPRSPHWKSLDEIMRDVKPINQ